MTRSNFLIKWGVYALALLPVWFFELYILNRFPVWGAIPMLLPQAAIIVAVLEGPVGGAGFGLGVGILFDAVHAGGAGGMTLGLALLGAGAGALARYALRQNLAGCLICSAGGLALIAAARVLVHLIRDGVALHVLLGVAVPELVWSLVFVLPLYFLFRWVYRRVPKKTVL